METQGFSDLRLRNTVSTIHLACHLILPGAVISPFMYTSTSTLCGIDLHIFVNNAKRHSKPLK